MLDHEYLNQVFYESLRLHPPAVMTIRECNEEIFLEDSKANKFKVEKGLGICIPIYSIQRDSGKLFYDVTFSRKYQHYFHLEFYFNADEFIPERFNPENGGVKSFFDRGLLIPFGDGPR